MMIVCSLLSGKLIQIFPIKKIVIGCAALMFAAGFGTYFVFNLPAILIMRVIYGMGSGTVFPLANAIIQQLYEGEEKARLWVSGQDLAHYSVRLSLWWAAG